MKVKTGRRRRSREVALQILYLMEMTKAAPDEAIDLFYELLVPDEDVEIEAPMSIRSFAEQLVQGVELYHSEIDSLIASASEHWRIERMSVVDRNILRLALYEMIHCSDIPPKVSINEAVDIGKAFGTEESGAFINGILDHILLEIEKCDQEPQPAP
ncbi:MAG: transcription antitermination factor NusB [Syntrophobacteraceae bacterium]|nr:transcription antitermination factor NusB [Desulfobacteraceae bacterium]